MELSVIYLWAAIIVVLFIIGYVIWHFVGCRKWEWKYNSLNEELKNLVKVYNDDTAELHKKNDELHAENVKLVVKLRDAETNMISYRTKIKSIETDNMRLKECKWHKKCCKKHYENKITSKPVVVNEQPKKKVGRPRKNW